MTQASDIEVTERQVLMAQLEVKAMELAGLRPDPLVVLLASAEVPEAEANPEVLRQQEARQLDRAAIAGAAAAIASRASSVATQSALQATLFNQLSRSMDTVPDLGPAISKIQAAIVADLVPPPQLTMLSQLLMDPVRFAPNIKHLAEIELPSFDLDVTDKVRRTR